MKERRSMRSLTDEELTACERYLQEEEQSRAMAEEHFRDVRKLRDYIHERGSGGFDKELVLEYKQYLNENYKTTSVDSMLVTINSLFDYLGYGECGMKLSKTQRVQFNEREKELTEKSYRRLAHTAERESDIRMSMLLQTIGSAGIRVSELRFITVETLEKGWAEIHNKRKSRVALLPAELMKALKRYYWKIGIKDGNIPITRSERLISRSNVSKWMKVLGKEAGVDTAKVFPHNFKHLFARVFYSVEGDVVRPMDLLRHSNISTTGIYTVGTKGQPRRQMSRMRVVLS